MQGTVFIGANRLDNDKRKSNSYSIQIYIVDVCGTQKIVTLQICETQKIHLH